MLREEGTQGAGPAHRKGGTLDPASLVCPGLCSLLASDPFPHRAEEGSGVRAMISVPFERTYKWPRDPLTQ